MVFTPTPPHKIALWKSDAFKLKRFTVDTAAAGAASLLVSPFIAVVDRGAFPRRFRALAFDLRPSTLQCTLFAVCTSSPAC